RWAGRVDRSALLRSSAAAACRRQQRESGRRWARCLQLLHPGAPVKQQEQLSLQLGAYWPLNPTNKQRDHAPPSDERPYVRLNYFRPGVLNLHVQPECVLMTEAG